MAEPVLTLHTLTEHSTVVIDGKAYALLSPDSLPAAGYVRLQKLAVRLEKLWNAKDDLTAAENAELESTLKGLCALMLEAPPDVLERLTDIQRIQVYQAFLNLPRPEAQAVGRLTQPSRKPGENYSLGSKGSTAGMRSRGGRKSRSRS